MNDDVMTSHIRLGRAIIESTFIHSTEIGVSLCMTNLICCKPYYDHSRIYWRLPTAETYVQHNK